MEKDDLRSRWSDPEFAASQTGALAAAFSIDGVVDQMDLRGLVVGEGSPVGLVYVGLHKRRVASSDLSCSRFECSFVESEIDACRFVECQFDGSNFSRSRLRDCQLDQSSFVACSFWYATVEGSSFRHVRFSDRRRLPCDLNKSRFLSCDFRDSLFKRVELRAAQFVECQWEGAVFEDCDLRGARFLGVQASSFQVVRSKR